MHPRKKYMIHPKSVHEGITPSAHQGMCIYYTPVASFLQLFLFVILNVVVSEYQKQKRPQRLSISYALPHRTHKDTHVGYGHCKDI